jgi:hypothetical protein
MKTTYKVTGLTSFAGHPPGEEFEAELDPDQERRAKARGSIRVVKRGETKHQEEKEEETADAEADSTQ